MKANLQSEFLEIIHVLFIRTYPKIIMYVLNNPLRCLCPVKQNNPNQIDRNNTQYQENE